MAQGSKQKYSEKQKRKAEKIEEGYRDKGVSKDEAEARAWATVNKQSGGGKRAGGSGRDTQQGTLEQESKDQLLREARRKNIKGRSTMRKQELVTALRRSA